MSDLHQTFYRVEISPVALMERVVSCLEDDHPGQKIEINKILMRKGLPKNDYGVTVEVWYELKNSEQDLRNGFIPVGVSMGH